MENLNEMTEEEEDLGMEGNKRLGCQCEVTGGKVVGGILTITPTVSLVTYI